jgi:hypothetical protein
MGRLLAGGSEDVAEDELRQALGQAGHALPVPLAPSPGIAGDQQPVEEWEGFPLADGLAALQCAVRAAPDQALRRAVELVTATGAALELIVVRLGPAALAGYPARLPGLAVEVVPDAMLTALNDPMWDLWGRHMPMLTDSPAWPGAAAFHTAMALHLPGLTGTLTAYRTRTESLIRPIPTSAAD